MHFPPTNELRDYPLPTPSREVLVIEDDGMVANLLVEALDRAGHRIELRASATEALRSVLRDGYRPDLVIADIDLKDASGLDVARMIRETVPGAAIVLISGHDPDHLPVEEIRRRGYHFLPKPFGVRQLHEVVGALAPL
jgi:DNA-binding NtrC family response regulator